MPSGYIIKWTDEQDEIIRDVYGKAQYPIKSLKQHPLFFNLSKDAIKRRAYKLGSSTKRRINYSNEEKEQIIKLLETKTPNQISKIMSDRTGRKITPMAMRGFISSYRLRTVPDFYSATDLVNGFRCSERTIRKWVDKGWLKVYRDPGNGGNNTHYRITPFSVVKFVTQFPYELDTCRADVPWLISLILEFSSKLNRTPKVKKSQIIEDNTI